MDFETIQLDSLYYDPEMIIDTAALSARVRNYLNYNQIQWGRFADLVLGVGQARLSVLIGRPKPWDQLKLRVKTYYQRMLEWMDTKATYGNNPYIKHTKKKPMRKNAIPRRRHAKGSSKPRTLFQWDARREEVENQKAIDKIVGLNSKQMAEMGRKRRNRFQEEHALKKFDFKKTLRSRQLDKKMNICPTSSSSESDEDVNGCSKLSGMEIVFDQEKSEMFTAWNEDIDEMVNAVNLPDLADMDLDCFSSAHLQDRSVSNEMASDLLLAEDRQTIHLNYL